MSDKPVHVYRNLTQKCWSVKQNGLVIDRPQALILRDCKFHIQQAGQERVRRERKKNVHAFVKGTRVPTQTHGGPMFRLTYNPYENDTFINAATGVAIAGASEVIFDTDGKIYGRNLTYAS